MQWHTQVSGMRKLVVAAMKMNGPKKSNVLSLSQIDPSLFCNRKQKGMPVAAMTQKGMLIQNIHLHVVFSANVPPITGPKTDPIAHCKLMTDIHFPRSLSVTRSARITYVNPTSPPPPTPCILLPTSSSPTLLATDATIVPTKNKNNAVSSTDFRPIICEKEAQVGL